MAESEMLYSSRQVTESLDCSPQMAGKYFQALEKITKTKIKTHGRQGRQFDSMTRDVLISARDIVRSNNGVTVEDAVRRALSLSQVPVAVELGIPGAPLDLAALESTLRAALRDEVTAPLLNELQVLRAELTALQDRVPAAVKEIPAKGKPDSLIVRLAFRIQDSLRR